MEAQVSQELSTLRRRSLSDGAEFARTLVGVPFKHQGRLVETGLDCVGVNMRVCAFYGVHYPEDTNYGPRGDSEKLLAAFDDLFYLISAEDSVPGDFILMTARPGGKPRHSGVRTELGVVHARMNTRRVVEERLHSKILQLVHSYWRPI